MQQYMDIKQQHNDCLLFFRLGDFYEMFYEDAQIAHKVLGITLTAKNKKSDNPIPMAGIPHHALDRYMPRLVKAGYKVALAEQVGAVVPGKVVEREVTQIVTPGTYIDENNPAARYICAVSFLDAVGGSYQLARGDYSLGEYCTSSFDSVELLTKKIAQIWPAEIVIDIDTPSKTDIQSRVDTVLSIPMTVSSVPHDASQYICSQLQVSTLDGYWQSLSLPRQWVFALLIQYIHHTQKRSHLTFSTIRYVTSTTGMHLDDITIKNLEIFSSSYEWASKQSLYGVMDTTHTAMWWRLLAQRLAQPLSDKNDICTRQQHVQQLLTDSKIRTALISWLSGVPDLPRLLTTLLWRKPSALKIQNLKMVLWRVLDHDVLLQYNAEIWVMSSDELVRLRELYIYLHTYIWDDHISDDSGYICDGVDAEIDRLRHMVHHSDELMLAYQQDLVQHSGITRIKIKYVTNQWYVIEVTPSDVDIFESSFDATDTKFDLYRQQTLKSGQRYMSSYLDKLQQELLAAQDILRTLEQELLTKILSRIESHAADIYVLSDALAYIDVLSSHADFAQLHARVMPHIQQWYGCDIVWGRHPVVEHYLPHTQSFIPNDLKQSDDDYFHLITGPNMWGKSTFLRQHALIVLLAHTGLCVPAKSATVWLVDGIFARVWSWDALAKNQSTFMTEMIEMSNILHNATKRSFVVLDELGRGTSTYDGLALAKSIVSYMVQETWCKTLFATHYHELTSLTDVLPWFSNRSVSVYETDQDVVFMKKIVKWWASKSYGLDVAKLAGVPTQIVSQARQFLTQLESKKTPAIVQTGFWWGDQWWSWWLTAEQERDLGIYKKLKQKLSDIDISHMTPVQAMVELERIDKRVNE